MLKFTSDGGKEFLGGRELLAGDVINIDWNNGNSTAHTVVVDEKIETFVEIIVFGNRVRFRPSQSDSGMSGRFEN